MDNKSSLGQRQLSINERYSRSEKIFPLLKDLFGHVSTRRRRQFFLLFLLTLMGSFAEMVSLGSVVPFIGVLTQPEKVFAYPRMAQVIKVLGISTPSELVMPLTIAFALAALVAGCIRLLLQWVSIMVANATGADIGYDAYRRTLYQPYIVHVARNSSEVISGITQKVGAASSVLVSLATVITSSVLFVSIAFTLVVINPSVAAVAALGFGSAYSAIAVLTRKRITRNSRDIAFEQTHVVKVMQEGLGAIRDLMLENLQATYANVYRKSAITLYRASSENLYITLAPRYAMETLAMVLVALFVYILGFRPGEVDSALPVLAVMALGAQRLLPLMQQFYGNWSGLMGSQASLQDVLKLLDQPMPDDPGTVDKPLVFRSRVELQHLYFRYHVNGPMVLNDINLTIEKGARIGFVGTTGSGKSTLVDLIMALLEPTNGRIVVDGHVLEDNDCKGWQLNLAHVPQQIFLIDASIAENIAFGVPADIIDMARVRRAAEQACIADYIEKQPEGYATAVGERGVRLSGGQRQRIGIARALYKQASVLILDEATSALDGTTEHAIMQGIQRLNRDLTVLMIAHRTQTLQDCDLIVRLEHGKIVAQQTYDQFMSGM